MRISSCVGIALACMAIWGCDTEKSLTESPELDLCENSGGTFRDESCLCKGYKCDDNRVCDLGTGSCMADSRKEGTCQGDETYCLNGQFQRCVEGQWESSVDCDSRACLNALQCLNACTESVCAKGVFRNCSDGYYEADKNCPYGCDIDGKRCESDACDSGTTRCANGVLTKCESGVWALEVSCSLGCEDNTKCRSECDEGAARCFDDKNGNGFLETCTGGVWISTPCLDDQNQPLSCDGQVCGECKNSMGFYGCANDDNRIGQLLKCNLGKIVKEPCQSSVSCDDSQTAACGECLNGNEICKNDVNTAIGYKGICIGGRLPADHSNPCPSNASCDSDATCGLCRNGFDQSCVNDNAQKGHMITCENGTFGSLEDAPMCFGEVSCNVEGSACGDCLNGFPKCDTNLEGVASMFNCVDAVWVEGTPCASHICANDVQCQE